MHEFYISHQKVTEGNVNFLIPILLEDLPIDELPRDLQTYLRTYTYIDAREYDMETLRRRIRFAMPDVPLQKLIDQQAKEDAGPNHADNLAEAIELEDIREYNPRVLRLLQGDGTILDVPFPVRLPDTSSSEEEDSEGENNSGSSDIEELE